MTYKNRRCNRWSSGWDLKVVRGLEIGSTYINSQCNTWSSFRPNTVSLVTIISPLGDPDLIIILFVIYLDAFKVEKFWGINLQGHFNGRSQFGKLGFKNFRGHFEESNIVFWCKDNKKVLKVFYTPIPFHRCENLPNRSLYVKFMPLASWPIVLTTMVREDATSTPVTHAYGASHVFNFKKILEGSKPYHNWGLRKSKIYP